MASIILPMLFGNGLIGAGTKAAGMTGKTKLLTDAGLNFGLDALISGTSDSASEAGNLGLLERVAPWCNFPWASRDSDSPDTIYWKNMSENMILGLAEPLATALTFKNAGNVVVPKNDTAKAIVDAAEEKPATFRCYQT